MTNRIVQKSFAAPAYPRRIEDDPMFNGWNRNLPRLWYLDQRQATRLDAESLYGASQYAVFYNRTQFTTLATPIETAKIGDRGYLRGGITDIGIPLESVTRHATYTRVLNTFLPTPVEDATSLRPSGGPVNPIVHPITAASIGEGAPPIMGVPNFLYLARVVGLQEGTLLFLTMEQEGSIVGVRAKRTGGGDISFNLSTEGAPIMAYDMSLPTGDSWYSYETSDITYTSKLDVGQQIMLEINDVVGTVWPDELLVEITFLNVPIPLVWRWSGIVAPTAVTTWPVRSPISDGSIESMTLALTTPDVLSGYTYVVQLLADGVQIGTATIATNATAPVVVTTFSLLDIVPTTELQPRIQPQPYGGAFDLTVTVVYVS